MKMLANGYNLEKNTSIYTYDFQIGDIFELQNQITKKNEKGLSHLARQTNGLRLKTKMKNWKNQPYFE